MVCGGLQNILVHGDLRNFDTEEASDFSYGFYAYAGKMFNAILGMEFRASYTSIGGGPQRFSEGFDVRYTTLELREVRFEGEVFGGRLVGVFNLSNLAPTGRRLQRKWNFAAYTGIGYHQYSSKLIEIATGEVQRGADFEVNPRRDDWAGSWYVPIELGVSYRINRRFDIELRTGVSINAEDHLDAAISDKSPFDAFFDTSLGVRYKIGGKRRHLKWVNPFDEAIIASGGGGSGNFELRDRDGDGVMDDLDKDNFTPPGVKVYGDGTSIDSDMDQTPDYKDRCPFKKGLPELNGCPPVGDTDGDGLNDDVDDCPTIPGPKSNNGCPVIPTSVLQELNYIAKNIYFEYDKADIKPRSFGDLNRIAEIIAEFPSVQFYVDGHTDSKGNDSYNSSLSKRRAQSVVEYLITRGVDVEQLQSRGFGESRPITSNNTEAGRQLNRRVEITLVRPEDGQ